MRCITFVVAASVVIPIDSLSAQQPPPVEVGQRVRVSYCEALAVYSGNRRTDCQTTEGTVVVMTNDSIVLAAGAQGAHRAIRRDLMTQLDVPQGRSSHPWRGAVVGAVTLGSLTYASVVAICDPRGSPPVCSITDAGLVGVSLAGAAVGGGLGAIVGLAFKTDRWEEVPLDQLRVSFAPKRDGFAFGLSLRF